MGYDTKSLNDIFKKALSYEMMLGRCGIDKREVALVVDTYPDCTHCESEKYAYYLGIFSGLRVVKLVCGVCHREDLPVTVSADFSDVTNESDEYDLRYKK